MKRFMILLGFLWFILLLITLLNLFVVNSSNFEVSASNNSLLGFIFFSLIIFFVLGIGTITRASFPKIRVEKEGFYLQFDGYESDLIQWQDVRNCARVHLGSIYGKPIYGISLNQPINKIFAVIGILYGLGTYGFLIDLKSNDSEKFFNTIKNVRQDLFLEKP